MSKVKLAILDDYQGIAESKFTHLSSRVEVQSFPDTLNSNDPKEREQLIERLKPFKIICTMRERTRFSAEVIQALSPNLVLLTTTGMRNASIDMEACKKAGVIVVGAHGVIESAAGTRSGTDSTIEHTWALILGLARRVAQGDRSIRAGGWQTGFAYGLKHKTIGLLGFGRLGSATARIAHAFGMKVLTWSSSLTQEKVDAIAGEFGLKSGTFELAGSKRELFECADVLSVHYVLSDRSRGIVGKDELAAMKSSALLVNTSRAPLIDDDALYEALVGRKIAGFASDVFDIEPLPKESRWREGQWASEEGSIRSLLLLSPHMGYVEADVMNKWYEETAANVQTWLGGGKLEARIA